ncbi:MAG TPA: MlaD family protein [Opitutus sp.]|nr:MlaD family protein [Opitutus sp.]
MNNAQQTARVGLFFLLGLALTWVTFETLSGGKLFRKEGYTLIAGFDSLKELKSGDEVRMAGVKVGVVEKTRLNAEKRRAEAVLRMNTDAKIPNDAVGTIAMAGLIGTNYISINLGTPGAPILPPGGELKTRTTPDLNSVMADLGQLGEKLQSALGAFGDAMGGNGKGPGLFQKLDRLVTENEGKITTTMTNLQDITTKLNQGEGTLGKLINDPALHDELLSAVQDIKGAAAGAKEFMGNAQAIIDQVKSGKGTLGTLVYDDTAAADLKATLANIRAVSDKIAKGEGTLGKLINDDGLYQNAQSTLKKADRALDSMSDSGPITAVGIVANSLF